MWWSDSLGSGVINMLMKNSALYFYPRLSEWYCGCPCDHPWRLGVWMGNNELRLNPSKTDGFGCLGLPVPRFFYFWYWMGGGTPSDGPDAKSRCPLESGKQMVAVAKRPFAHLQCVCQLHPFLDWEVLLTVIHTFMTSHLDYWNVVYMGLVLRKIQMYKL